MKKIYLAAMAVAIVAAPAAAQWAPGPWNPNTFWQGAPDNPYERIQFLQDRVTRGLSDGSLNRREANRISGEINGVRNWIQRMHWEGGRLTPDQRARVQARLDQISRQIRWMRHDGR
ncbi:MULTISPECIES: hypothetical protein [Sphingomonas]|uniref:hypothetical protein n=1 Tax=Sphingomonas TaxID=13687 RepID=UPI000DEF2365|nr:MULTISPECIES: hypothetical protein [Sphingomonas]